jgi:hypothetical protein
MASIARIKKTATAFDKSTAISAPTCQQAELRAVVVAAQPRVPADASKDQAPAVDAAAKPDIERVDQGRDRRQQKYRRDRELDDVGDVGQMRFQTMPS